MSQAVLSFVLERGRVPTQKVRTPRIVRPVAGALTPSEAARVLGVGVEFMRSKAVDPDYGFTVLLGQDRNKFFFKPASELLEEARKIPEFMLKYGKRLKSARIHKFTSGEGQKATTCTNAKWLTIAEAAEYLKVDEKLLRYDRQTGKYGIPSHKLEGGRSARLYYIKRELYNWKKKNAHILGKTPKKNSAHAEHLRKKKLFWKMLDMIL